MKCNELIEILKNYPPDASVVAEYDMGWTSVDEHWPSKDVKGQDVVVLNVGAYNSYEDERWTKAIMGT